MTARFVRERRCVICDHRVHLAPDNRPSRVWNSQCDEGCQCTTALCQPYRIFMDGTTDRLDMGPFASTNNQQEHTAMTTPQQQAPNADDFLMGGGGAASAKFPTPGTTVAGRITERPTVEQQRDIKTGEKKFWNDGNPMMQLVVTVQTQERDPADPDDDGRRRLFVKGQLKNAVADAVRAAGARGLEIGGELAVTYTHDGQASQRGFNPPKQYTARYTPAANAELNTPDPAPAGVPAGVNTATGEITTPTVPGLTAEQVAAAQQNPALAALLQQATAAQPAPQGSTPPF